jgi:outer membrane protein assembly factor BamB
MSSTPPSTGSYQFFPARRGLYHLGLPGTVLVVGGAAIMILSMQFHHVEHQWPNMAKMGVIAAMLLILAFWAIFLSGLHRLRTGIVLLLAASLCVSLVTVDFTGNMEPSLHFRSWVTRLVGRSHDDDLLSQRQKQQAEIPAVEVDLTPKPTDFPGYRGADRTGMVLNCKISHDWGTHPPKELWKQPIGGGYGAFAVVNDFLFTLEQRRNLDEGADEEAVVCYHAKTGRELWAHHWPGRFDEALGGAGPRSTPTVIDGEVYALGAKGHLCCLDGKTGNPKWEVETLRGRKNLHWGMSCSPLVLEKVVVVNAGPPGALAAYDRQSGKVVWAEGNHQAGYSSPMLATLAAVRQILLFDGRGIAGCDPASGKELWRLVWKTQGDDGINVAQPVVVGSDQVFIASAYGKGGAMLKVSRNEQNQWTVETLWDTDRVAMRCKFSSPVVYNGYLYGLDDGHLQCIDLNSGKVIWTDKRRPAEENGAYSHGQILLCDNLLVVLTEYGEVAIIEPTPEKFNELGRRKFLSGNKTWNNPAISDGILYIRNHVEMAAIDLRGQ